MAASSRQVNCTRARTWVLAMTSVPSLMVALDGLVVTTALSTIRVHLGASIEQLVGRSSKLYEQWVTTTASPG
jgi:hypothetical protein